MIYEKIVDLIGNTPVVYYGDVGSNKIYLKLEKFNPGGSIKDRIAFNMINKHHKELIKSKSTIIEATSGNTGVGLALVCAFYKIPLIIIMPENSSQERRDIMEAYGAQIILTKALDGMDGSIKMALQLCKDNPHYRYINQFENIDNPEAHYQNTALEIEKDFPNGLDYIVCGVGTSGTLNGLSSYLLVKYPQLSFIAVEPLESNVLNSGCKGSHQISGIGAGFIPKFFPQNLDKIMISDIKSNEALQETRDLAREGYLLGISSCAAILAAKKLCQEIQNKTILVICPDGGERYMSTGVFKYEEK